MIALFFDTETTGLKSRDNPEFKPALVQMGAILQDMESRDVMAEINLIGLQEGHIPEGASNVHGISDDVAARFGFDQRIIDMVFAGMVRMCDVVVAHNIDYDLDIVKDNMPKSWPRIKDKIHFCTKEENIEIVKAEWPDSKPRPSYYTSKGDKPARQYKWPSLMETYEYYFAKQFEGAHDAMADIRACRDIFFAMEDVDTIIAAKAAEMAQKEAEKPLELAL